MKQKKILIVGNGGREHAIAWKLAQSENVEKIWVAPGNAGTAQEEKTENVAIAVTDLKALAEFAKKNEVDLTFVGPEVPLSLGIVDYFTQQQMVCFGPTQQAAQLESSKQFCKEFLTKYKIPTAKFASFTNNEEAQRYLLSQSFPIVIKASGLAAGKGVIIANSLQEAQNAVHNMLVEKYFQEAGDTVVIEEYLTGQELSYLIVTDGQDFISLASCQDYKRRDDGDHGPNTGGMGTYSPTPFLTKELETKIINQVIQPTLDGLAKEGIPYQGFLYAGLMITAALEPKVLEFNCRLGDPETQPIMMRMQSDLLELCEACITGKLSQFNMQWDARVAVHVVMAAGGYPESYERGDIISGIPLTPPDIKVFHAGTRLEDHNIITDGGRVLGVSALADTFEHARQKAYAICQKIRWENAFYRNDIGEINIHSEKI